MMGAIVMGAAAVAGYLSVEPIGAVLAPRVVGCVVPTRPSDLLGYLSLSASPTPSSMLSPITCTDPTQAKPLKELSALSLGGGLVVGAVAYALLGRIVGGA